MQSCPLASGLKRYTRYLYLHIRFQFCTLPRRSTTGRPPCSDSSSRRWFVKHSGGSRKCNSVRAAITCRALL
jgi:hypothetical protein